MQTQATDTIMTRRQMLRTLGMGLGAGLLAAAVPSAAQVPIQPGQIAFDLDSLLVPLRNQYGVPALAGGVMIGETIFRGAVGLRKWGDAADVVTHADQFHIGSCTKAMTATLIGMLIDQGVGGLQWNTKVSDIFPEYKLVMHPAYKNLTVDHLLAHRSGFSSDSLPADQSVLNVKIRAFYTGAVLQEAPVVPLGWWQYSNRNYTVLGAIVERLVNDQWENIITQWIFQPLGMSTAGFGPMGDNTVNQPWQHVRPNGVPVPIAPIPWSDNPEIIGPAGTVHCSARHWMDFVQEHYRGLTGTGKLMSQATYQRLHAPQFNGTYAGGWGQQDMAWSPTVYNHAGSNLQNYAIVMLSISKKFAVVALTNEGGTNAMNCCNATGAMLVSWAQKNGYI